MAKNRGACHDRIDRRVPVSGLVGIGLLFCLGILFAGPWSGCAHVTQQERVRVARSIEQYLPLAVGNRWTYSTEFQGQAQKDLQVTIVERKGGYFIDDRPVPTRYRFDAQGLRDGTKRYILKAPLVEGNQWMSVADVKTVERYRIVRAGGEVRAPAGVFSECVTVRMEVRMSDKRSMQNEITFAPGVGIVEVRAALIEGAKVIPQSRFVLKSYEFDQRSAGSDSPPP